MGEKFPNSNSNLESDSVMNAYFEQRQNQSELHREILNLVNQRNALDVRIQELKAQWEKGEESENRTVEEVKEHLRHLGNLARERAMSEPVKMTATQLVREDDAKFKAQRADDGMRETHAASQANTFRNDEHWSQTDKDGIYKRGFLEPIPMAAKPEDSNPASEPGGPEAATPDKKGPDEESA